MIATRFETLYRHAIERGLYDDHPVLTKPIYGIPHKSRPLLDESSRRYRGIDRYPLFGITFEMARRFTEQGGVPTEANGATVVLDEIEVRTGREDGWVTEPDDILRAWMALDDALQTDYEVIFAKEHTDAAKPPPGTEFLGCDVAYFTTDHFSCVCDALFFPRWHGTDGEGTLFLDHFERLNRNGLFEANSDALEYLEYYLSFDWTERSDMFTSIEVYSVRFDSA